MTSPDSASRGYAAVSLSTQSAASVRHTQPDIRSVQDYAMATDERLLVSAQSGDRQAFAELSSRHSTSTRKAIYRIVRNKEDAEDMLQDTLLRAFVHLGTFRGDSRFSTWLTSIGVNRALMLLRKRRIAREVDCHVRDEDDGTFLPAQFVDSSLRPDQLLQRKQIELMVRREVRKLKPSLRSPIEKRYGAECSVEETAESLSIPITTAKARLMRGRSALRQRLTRLGIVSSRA